MNYRPLPEVAANFGFDAQELGTVLLHGAHDVLLQKAGKLYCDPETVVMALDEMGVPIPRDPRSPAHSVRHSAPMPAIGHTPPPRRPRGGTAVAASGDDDYYSNGPAGKIIDAEVVEEGENDRRQGSTQRPGKRPRRS